LQDSESDLSLLSSIKLKNLSAYVCDVRKAYVHRHLRSTTRSILSKYSCKRIKQYSFNIRSV